MVKLLRIIRTTNPAEGGPIEGLMRTSQLLVRWGHHVEIVSLETPSHARARSIPYPVYALGYGTRRYGYNPRLVPWLKENAARYDAVIVHGLWNYVSFGSWRGLRNSDIPYFIFCHGMLDPWFASRYPFKHAAKLLFWHLSEGRVLRDANAVLFTSEEELRRARQAFSGFSYSARVIPYGAANPFRCRPEDRQAWLRTVPNLEAHKFLLYLGRIHPKKGIDLLLRAFAAVLGEIPPDVDLVIAGPDESGVRAGLTTLAHSLHLNDRVHWTGMLESNVKWAALQSAEALILPSHQENFGIVVAEALACSVPVLITDKVNIWREVVQCGAGFAAPDTVEGIRTLLRSYFSLPSDQRRRMCHAARLAYEKHFTVEAAAHGLISLIAETLHSTAACPATKCQVASNASSFHP